MIINKMIKYSQDDVGRCEEGASVPDHLPNQELGKQVGFGVHGRVVLAILWALFQPIN